MSRKTYKSFAMLEAGSLASPLAEVLAGKKNGASVVVFTRHSSKRKHFPQGASYVSVDFTDVPVLTEQFRLHNCEVVISAINDGHLAVQTPTLEAAKKADVKLYVPSEYGIPSEGQDDQIKAAGIPYVRLYLDSRWNSSGDWNKEAILIGKGETVASRTALPDLAGYLAHVLTHLPQEELNNQTLRIEGQQHSLLQLASLYGDPIKIVYTQQFPDEIDNPRLREHWEAKIEAGVGTVT